MIIKTTRELDTASDIALEEDRISAAELAKSQWALIHDLEHRYKGKTVYGTNCQFEDDKWFSIDSRAGASHSGINWTLIETAEPALQALMKTHLFDAIFERRLEIGYAKDKFYRLRSTIIPLIENKKALAGQDGSLILGLSHLTDEDLLLMLDMRILSASSELMFRNECNDLANFHAFANHIAEQVPVYQIRARLPWQKTGEPVFTWVKRRAVDLSMNFPETEGFDPLTSETVQPLVEKSLNLIDLYFDHFAEIAPIVARHNSKKRYERKFLLGILEKYGPIFSPIMAAPDINGVSRTLTISQKIFPWLRNLLYLARGACINVILLTTGLRNVDVRGLKVDDCSPSGRVDMLFYLRADIQKTKNVVVLPVPNLTDKAIRLLEKIKFTDSPYLLDAKFYSSNNNALSKCGIERFDHADAVNELIYDFAAHLNIPFINPITGERFTAHNYRTTVAGWLGAASNLSLLLVRRLFGHSNNVMPTVYLNNNPIVVAERNKQKAQASAETARQMALAASQGRLAGIKGEQLERGYQAHRSRMESDKQKSHALTDAEIIVSFAQILEQRINSGSMCGFLTPFGVVCGRNPTDTSQSPCAERANRDKTQGITPELLKHLSDINPEQCIGTSCTEAMLGPWSTSVLETLNWYYALVRHQLGDAFTEKHFIESAKQFIKQYQAPIRKVFGIAEISNDTPFRSIDIKVVSKNG